MGRKPCCDKVGLKRGPWDTQEDQQLVNFMLHNTNQSWRIVPRLAGLKRCGKSCRLRWINYLRPDLKRGDFTQQEEDQIIQLPSTFGNKWSKIASHFPGRTDNEIKNHWHCKIKKKLKLLEGSVNSRISCDQQQLVSKLGPKEVDDIIPNISASKENDMTMTCESNVNDINGWDKLELSSTTIFLSVDHNSNSIMSSHNVDISREIFDDYSCLSVKNFQLQYYWRESSMELESLLSLEGFDNLEDIISL